MARNILQNIGREIKINPPSIIGKTKRKFGLARAESQRKAILLNKSRRAGARIPHPRDPIGIHSAQSSHRGKQISAIKRKINRK